MTALSRRSYGIAGLVLIPLGIALLLSDVATAGGVILAAGWLLALAALAIALREPHQPPMGSVPRWMRPPTFIMATAVSAAAVAAAEPLAGVAVAYVAILWFYARFWDFIA